MNPSSLPQNELSRPASRTLVIGLDGATWQLFNPLITKGLLPNLQKLVSNGATGALESTIPPVTASAWSSFYTGRNPGHHGIYDFRKRMGPDSTERAWVNQSNIGGPLLWEILAAQNKSVGLLNLPLTYPPVDVNGYMIGGMPVPSTRPEIGKPDGIIEELIGEIGNYISDIDLLRGESPDVTNPAKCAEFVSQVGLATESRGRAARFLMQKYPADFTFIVLVTPDRLSHLFWKVLSPETGDPPFHDWENDLLDKMHDVFIRMDNILGDIAAQYTDDDLVVVMSDHGFGRLDEILKLNILLKNLGYLKFKPEADGGFKRKVGRFLPESIKKPLRSMLHMNNPGSKSGSREKHPFDPYSLIDWTQTLAYSGGSVEQGVFLNVDGREPGGRVLMGAEYFNLRDRIMADLGKVLHPSDGKPLFDWVEPRENIYSGEYLENAPDIIFCLRDYKMVVGEDAIPPLVIPWSQPRAGFHRRNGVLVLKGPMVKKGFEIDHAGIADVAPTILACMGLESDGGMDGVVIRDALDPGFLDKFPPATGTFEETAKILDTCGEDAGEMEDLIKGLGYLN